ncbi:MAG: nucleotidyltransferase domain-containing protein [Candidatus Latescibacteria bacterium]|nr:nucleotidyltransferase domain-containing protein [Candidatus Latescibacterota bacterium]
MGRSSCPPRLDEDALNQLHWWLTLPPVNLIARGDVIRFRHALYLIVHQVTAVLFGLNGQPVRMTYPSTLSDGRSRLDALPIRPDQCGLRLEQMVTAGRMEDAWAVAARLIGDVSALTIPHPLSLPRGERKGSSPWVTVSPLPAVGEGPGVRASLSPDKLVVLAQQAAQWYHRLPGLDGIALTGSLARGYADAMSDVDLSVYCRAIPAHDARRAVAAGLPGVRGILIEHACDTAWVEGTLVHVRYWQTYNVERMVAAFPAPPSDAFLAEDLQVCVPLYDVSGRLQAWKARVQAFAPHLKAELLAPTQRRRPAFARAWSAALAAHDVLHLHCLANQAANDWLIALFAMNDRFLTTPRWCRDEMRRFAIIPAESEARLLEVVEPITDWGEAGNRWRGLHQLWEEVTRACGTAQ